MFLSILLLFFMHRKCPNLASPQLKTVTAEQMQGSVKMKNYQPFKGTATGSQEESGSSTARLPCSC